ncbi:MAG: DinB family protein [Bryobacteraceae bacterium]|nr:DinB family protein [Bryobacteraceae bacterium]
MAFSLQPEQAQLLASIGLTWIEKEWETTRKVIAAIPVDRQEYRPEPKARTAIELAWHIAVSEAWFLDGILQGEFQMEEPGIPEDVKTPQDVIAWYERSVVPLIARTREIAPEALAAHLSFFGMFNYPAVIYLNFVVSHAIHHRGQLSTYLRPMGGKVPSIYGGSADEPFETPTS